MSRRAIIRLLLAGSIALCSASADSGYAANVSTPDATQYQASNNAPAQQSSSLTGAFPLGHAQLQSRTVPPKIAHRSGDAAKSWTIAVGAVLLILLLIGAAARMRRRLRARPESEDFDSLISARAYPTRPAHRLLERGSRRTAPQGAPTAARTQAPATDVSDSPGAGRLPAGKSPAAEVTVAAHGRSRPAPEADRPKRSPLSTSALERTPLSKAAMLGRRFERRGKLAAAEVAYRQASEEGSVGGAYNLGVLLHRRAELDGAEAAYRTAARRGDAVALLNLGLLLHERGDLKGAENAWRRADARGNPQAAANLGVLLLDQGDFASARKAQRRARERGDERGAAHLAQLITQRTGAKASG